MTKICSSATKPKILNFVSIYQSDVGSMYLGRLTRRCFGTYYISNMYIPGVSLDMDWCLNP